METAFEGQISDQGQNPLTEHILEQGQLTIEGQNQKITVARVDHLPIVACYLRKLGLVQIVNGLVPVDMEVEPGIIFLGLVLDTLSGRSPLYHLQAAFEEYDRELLFGQNIPAGYFSDDNVGRVMDHVYEVGTQKIFSALTVSAMKQFSLSTEHVHFDTTSVNVHGEYLNSASDSSPFEITHGHSKDHRPDLKQFVLSLLCVGGDVPIIGKLEDGNASDKKINNSVLSDISKHINKHGIASDGYIYVADSAMVTKANLELANRFITRLPATYNECERAIMSAIDEDQWVDVGCMAMSPGTEKRPNAKYRVNEQEIILYDKKYRAIVVHSSAHDKRRQKRLGRDINKSLKKLNSAAKKYGRRTFSCRADAEGGLKELMTEASDYHHFETETVECPRYSRGRPKPGVTRVPISIDYKLSIKVVENEQEITRRRKMSGCFVLLTNVEPDWSDGYDAERILATYKEQYGIERNYGFLKDPKIVNAIFLKKPERIEALGLVLLISLLAWRLMENTMRTELKAKDGTIRGWDNKPTKRPTSYMVTWKFKGIMIVRVGGRPQLGRPLSEIQKAFLEILKVPVSCFTGDG